MPKQTKKRRDAEPVYSITSAREAHSDELGEREMRYVISMALRSVCFVLGVVAWLYVAVWLGAILLTLAVVLPYTSVIIANAGVRRKGQGDHYFETVDHTAIDAGPRHDETTSDDARRDDARRDESRPDDASGAA